MSQVATQRRSPELKYQRRVTAERKAAFLTELRKHGVVTAAARAASPHASPKYGCLASFKEARRKDPIFAQQWDDAVDEATARIEQELHRRAVEGWNEPVYQKGEMVGTITRYSDKLMELLAIGVRPDKYGRRDVHVTGAVQHQLDGALVLKPDDLLALSAADRREMIRLLEIVGENRGEQKVEHVPAAERSFIALQPEAITQ